MDEHKGRLSTCTTQAIAYCLQVTNAPVMSRQTLCARTAENCELRKEDVRKNPVLPYEVVSECRPIRNTEDYDFGTLYREGD